MNKLPYIGGDFRDGDNAPFLIGKGDAERYFPDRIGAAIRACFETGSDALAAILESLGGPRRMWVPAHFCQESITRARKKTSRAWDHLNYDRLASLDGLLEKDDALLFLHFNARDDAGAARAADLAMRAGAILIEDFAHAPFDLAGFRGEAAFNSLRKFARLEVAVAYCRRGALSGMEMDSRYYRIKQRAARAKDAYALKPDPGLEREYLALYGEAEAELQSDRGIVLARIEEMGLWARFDFGAILAARRRNHARLAERLSRAGITPLPGDYAYAMARFGERDKLREWCFAHGVFPPIHWLDCDTLLSREILSLPVDQRYGPGDMDRVADLVETYRSTHSSSA